MAETNDRLAGWLLDLAKDFKQERDNILEPIWRMSYDAFRGKFSSENLKRWKALEGHEWRSKIFVRLTKMKIISGVSTIEDIEFQGGSLPWEISPTPVPEDGSGLFLPPDIADERCRRMSKRIQDNMAESGAMREVQKSNLEQAIYGISCLESPVVRPFSTMNFQLTPPVAGAQFSPEFLSLYGTHEPVQITKQIPTLQYCPIWEMLWDLEAENAQVGQGIFRWQMMSPGRFMDLADNPLYNAAAIRQVADRFIGKSSGAGADPNEAPSYWNLTKRRKTIPVYQYVGRVPIELVKNRMTIDERFSGREIEIVTCFAGDDPPVTIRAPKPSFYPGQVRPWHIGTWEDLPGESGGVGIAENLQDSQMMVNSSVRSFIDNKALASNLLIFCKSNAMAAGQTKDLWTGKWFELANGVRDVREAMSFQTVPDAGVGIVDMINMFERFADEESNMPKILEGENPRFNPQTAFAFGQLMESANKTMGRVIRSRELQQYLPIIKSLYHWEMLTNPDESIKGDYTCKATGYSTYLNKLQRVKTIGNLLTLTLGNQLLGMMIDPYAHLEEIYRGSDLDPERFLKPKDVVEARVQQMLSMIAAPPGLAPPPQGEIVPEGM